MLQLKSQKSLVSYSANFMLLLFNQTINVISVIIHHLCYHVVVLFFTLWKITVILIQKKKVSINIVLYLEPPPHEAEHSVHSDQSVQKGHV